MKNVLITGASGMLGSNMCLLMNINYNVTGTYFSNKPNINNIHMVKMDIRNKKQCQKVVKTIEPDIVIHCAAITDMDLCETNQTLAYDVNTFGTENILDSAPPAELVMTRLVKFIGKNSTLVAHNASFDRRFFQNELDLLAVPEWNGEPLYQSYLITKFDREASKLADLKGDIHAFSDPDSNSGYLVTKALLQENGLSAESFFKKTLFTYSHRNVIRAVASGLVQSGSVDGYVWEVIREIDPDLVAGTKIVRKSDWFGFPPIAVSKRFAQTKKVNALKLAFLSSSEAEAGRAMLDYLRLTGFVNAKPALYDSVKRNVDRLGALL